MKIILNQDVRNLGEEGDVCEVKDGYGRNFLLPKGIAVPYTTLNINNFKAKEQLIAARKEQKRKEALGIKERLEKETTIDIVMPSADGGHLFGSVTSATIAEYLAHQGIDVERKRIEVPGRTIKVVGNYVVKVRLYDEQSATLKLTVRSLEKEKKEEEVESEEVSEAGSEVGSDVDSEAEQSEATEAAPPEEVEAIASEAAPAEEENPEDEAKED